MKNDKHIYTFEKMRIHLRNLRKDLSLSQKEMANKLGWHQTYISQLEKGYRVPSLENLIDISNALDIELHTILDFRYLET
ncbi:MAG: transcriptional regulator [Candidatus Cloacimonadota bacterium]|nr:MAG: transcriptional regulator [Candidatus Cloacimonadota bacterium]